MTTSDSSSTDDAANADLRDWRERILNGALLGATGLGLPACVTSVALSWAVGLRGLVALDLAAYGILVAVTLRRETPYPVRGAVLIGVFAAVGFGVLVAAGPYSVGLAWLVAVPCLAAILFGLRAFVLTEALVAAGICAAAVADARWPQPVAASPGLGWWLMAIASLGCLSTIISVSASTAMHGLHDALLATRRQQDGAQRRNAELRQEMERRQIAERQLVLAQKMEVVGQMAGGIAHDFNNVLTVIQLEAMLALDRIDEPGAGRANLDAILEATRRASDLSSKLLLFSRNTPTERRRVRLDDEVGALATLLRRLVGERVELRIRLGAPGANVLVEPNQLEQILTNLAANARDAMPNGGTLELRTGAVEGERPLVRIDVRDTGRGMDAETRARVFEPFYTTKSTGTGLGLTTVYAIASALGGAIELASEPDQGTSVTVWLPQADGGQVELHGHGASPSPFALPPERLPVGSRVLVVDDQDAVRSTIAEGLRRMGCRVWTAASADEAGAIVSAMTYPPDLVLTDVVMPGTQGVELCERLARLHPGIALAAMSGNLTDARDHARLSALGVAILGKPFTPEDLLRVVAGALNRRIAG